MGKISKAKMPQHLEASRDWLITGCFTGQRVSDLLRMNKKMIFTEEDISYISIQQKKTKTKVVIPIFKEVLTILDKYDGNFPPVNGNTDGAKSTLFNRAIKEVCKLAGIDERIKGSIFDEVTKRKTEKTLPKYHFVTSHICRRSFASNFYGQPQFTPPLIMAITGHKSENTFLTYIGKPAMDFSREFAKIIQGKDFLRC